MSTNHALHDFVDGAISGEARLAASSPANERKTLSAHHFLTYFVLLIRRHNSCKNFGSSMLKMAGEVERK